MVSLPLASSPCHEKADIRMEVGVSAGSVEGLPVDVHDCHLGLHWLLFSQSLLINLEAVAPYTYSHSD